ncbi:MAG TPA: hypothetical protein VH475_13035 [Tepidisphaeraceae bacterium]
MNTDVRTQSWDFDLFGTASVITPSGAEIILTTRLQWLLTADASIRLLLSFDGIPLPVVRLTGPIDPHRLTTALVAALAAVTDELTPHSAGAEAT